MFNRTLEILRETRQLIERPQNWTRDCFARTRFGEAVTWSNPSADSWCLYGAIQRATQNVLGEPNERTAVHAVMVVDAYLRDDYGTPGLSTPTVEFNDSSDHAQVIQTLDEIIATLETPAVEAKERELVLA